MVDNQGGLAARVEHLQREVDALRKRYHDVVSAMLQRHENEITMLKQDVKSLQAVSGLSRSKAEKWEDRIIGMIFTLVIALALWVITHK